MTGNSLHITILDYHNTVLVFSAFCVNCGRLYQGEYLDLITQDWNLARIGQKKISTNFTVF